MRAAVELSREYLQAYLPGLWNGAHVEVTLINKFPRGLSRETWFIECLRDNAPVKLVLRRDFPSGSIVPTSLRFEYDIYDRLKNSKVPVARTIIYEDDPQKLPDDRHFCLREQVDGDWDNPNYLNPDPQHDALRIAMAREHVRKLALVHTCDWQAMGFADLMPVPKSTHDAVRCSLDRYRDILAGYQIEPMPILTEAREWLLDNAPVAPRIALLKGTNGRGEEVFRDGEIVAMSDWEQAALGDPASDFARTQDFFGDIERDGKKIWGMKQALEYYEEVSGIHVTPESVRFYHVLNSFENAICLHHAAVPLADKTNLSVRLVWLATEAMHYSNMLLLGAVSNQQVDAGLVYSTQTSTVKEEA